jgi:hypothetical protein
MIPSLDWNQVFQSKQPPMWGKLIRSPNDPGKLVGYRITNWNDDVKLFFPEDLPGNRWFEIYNARLPLLADQIINWKGQGIALCASDNLDALANSANKLETIVNPFSLNPWYESSEVLFRQSISKKDPNFQLEPLESFSFTHTLETSMIPTITPSEIWAHFNQGKVFIQAPGSWPYLSIENAHKILEIEEDNIFFEVPPNQAPSSLMSPFLCVGSLYAGILAVKLQRTVRFLLDDDFLNAWPCLSPDLKTEISIFHSKTGEIKNIQVHSQMNVGFKGPLVEELTNRFLYTFYQAFPNTGLWVETWSLETHSTPRLPPISWPESVANLICHRILQELARRLNPKDYDPLIVHSPNFLELFDYLNKKTFWRRWWAIDKINWSAKAKMKEGSGLAFGFHNSGFIEPPLTNCSVRLLYSIKEKSLEISAPLSISKEILVSIKRILDTSGESPSKLLASSWFDAHADNPGPSLVGRSLEILPSIIFRAWKEISKKRKSSKSNISKLVLYRRPKTKIWDPVHLKAIPYISTTPHVVYVKISFDKIQEILDIKKIVIVVDSIFIENQTEINSILFRNAWQICRWFLEGINFTISSIQILVKETKAKSEFKSLQHILWTTLPAALLQALRQIIPNWKPTFYGELFNDNTVEHG